MERNGMEPTTTTRHTNRQTDQRYKQEEEQETGKQHRREGRGTKGEEATTSDERSEPQKPSAMLPNTRTKLRQRESVACATRWNLPQAALEPRNPDNHANESEASTRPLHTNHVGSGPLKRSPKSAKLQAHTLSKKNCSILIDDFSRLVVFDFVVVVVCIFDVKCFRN